MSTSTSAKMICPRCGVEMNFHAEKIIYSELAGDSDAIWGGHLEEMHACPRCGRTESRHEQPGR